VPKDKVRIERNRLHRRLVTDSLPVRPRGGSSSGAVNTEAAPAYSGSGWRPGTQPAGYRPDNPARNVVNERPSRREICICDTPI
jgi:hypothetical protein